MQPTILLSVESDSSERPSAWASFWRTLTRFERDRVQPGIGLRNAVGITIPLAVGVAAGAPEAGLVGATGALNVSFIDSSDPYLLRAGRMLAATALSAVAVVAGSLCGGNDVFAIGAPMLWALGAGMMVALDPAAADIGLISLVTLVIFTGQPVPPEQALQAGLLACSGGLLQIVLALAFWPIQRYEPERRVLGALYRELSRVAALPASAASAPPASAETTQARKLLSGLWWTRSIQGERYLSLLNQAERLRLGVMMLARLRGRLQKEGLREEEAILSRCSAACSQILAAVAQSVESGRPAVFDPSWLQSVHEAGEELRARPTADGEFTSLIEEAVHQVDAVGGQLRAVIDLSASSTPAGRAAFERREAGRPWRLRLAGTLVTLRANFTLRSAALQHAIRLSLCIGVGQALARESGLERAYWVPMTIAIVLKPDFTSTFSRGALRVAGTGLGLLLATGLFEAISPTSWVDVLLIGALAFILRCFGPANYGIFAVAISAMVVLMFALSGVPPRQVIVDRGWNTLLGGALALLVYALWPTWERSLLPNRLAQLLDAYRSYFRLIRESYVDPQSSRQQELDRVRLEARLARSNLEVSAERFAAEPGSDGQAVQRVNAMLASSHRLVHAIMALEAGLARSRAMPARSTFIDYANSVEITLHSLAEALRGSRVRAEDLPDLREAHNALVNSGDPIAERYALVNVETDRITNSLNTLQKQVLEWAGIESPADEK